MTLESINPDDLYKPSSYTHVIVATGGRLVFIAGQAANDAEGSLVAPDDLAAQARQCSPTSVALSPRPVPGRTRWPGSRSSSCTTNPTICR